MEGRENAVQPRDDQVTSRAPKKRNAEVSIVTEASRWRYDVLRFVPERIDGFNALMQHAMEHPAPLVRRGAQ